MMQLLRLLAEAYLLNNKAGPALQCVQNLRKLDVEHASHQSVFLSAIRAYIQVVPFWIPQLSSYQALSSAITFDEKTADGIDAMVKVLLALAACRWLK